jgi:hypothetical protein
VGLIFTAVGVGVYFAFKRRKKAALRMGGER